MKYTYERSTKVLTVYFKHKEVIGFNCQGIAQYRLVDACQKFMGVNKQDCLRQAKIYVAADPLHRIWHKNVTSGWYYG